MRKVKIFSTNYYISFEGYVFDAFGAPISLKTFQGFSVFYYRRKRYYVHRVVAETFIKPSKKPIRHLDGDKQNNAAWNLEYY